MAFKIELKYVTTSKRESVKGLAYPWSLQDGGYASTIFDEAAVIQGLSQLIRTQKGERVMYPDLGTTLKRRLFNPVDNVMYESIKEELSSLIRLYEPRVYIKGLRVGSPEIGSGAEENSELWIQMTLGFVETPSAEQIVDVIIRPNG